MADALTSGETTTRERLPGEAHAVLQMAALAPIHEHGPLVITEATGNTLRDVEGREFFDGINGLFNVNVGYGRHELADVAAATMRRIGFGSNFFGRTTVEALELSEKLAEITPASLNRFFFTVGGSDAIDTAIKLTRHANILAGQPEKMTVIARRDGYHGMTMGGTTATGIAAMRSTVGPLLPGVVHIGQPGRWGDNATADELEQTILEEGPHTVAAFLGEPISLPPGLAIPPDDYWPAIRDVCTRYDVRLIADEVICGFGRTGRMFACENWGIEPDLMTMSKGITSGYMPLGAVGLREEHYETLLGSDGILPHGFTAGGHPVSCAVALANIDIIEREGLVENAAVVGEHIAARLDELQARYEVVVGVRSKGMLGAFDLDGEALVGAADAARAGAILTAELAANGVLVRPYGTTMVFGPALSTPREEIDGLFARFSDAIESVQRG
jgi:adenosylmethionine-8-amino-7-oxononanoate aminotransferase